MFYIFLADGFEELEATAPIDILKRGGVEVLTVGVYSHEVCGSHGIKYFTDITIDEVDLTKLDGIILPGGIPGTPNLDKSVKLHNILDFAFKNEKLMCAICAAPSIFGKAGYLNGKKATCYPGFENTFGTGIYTGAKAEKDKNIITGAGAGTAYDFAFEILGAAKNAETVAEVKKSMLA